MRETIQVGGGVGGKKNLKKNDLGEEEKTT
jgi:hypothetical protein